MTKCSNCSEAFYCSVECQRKHWPQHKSSCEETVERTIELADKIREHREMKLKSLGMSTTYYWGNVPAVDLINLSMNEGEEYSNPLALLFCGVGDPRNVLLTIATLPDVYKQQVTFVLNDICPCTLARTVLLLYMLNKGDGFLFFCFFVFLILVTTMHAVFKALHTFTLRRLEFSSKYSGLILCILYIL